MTLKTLWVDDYKPTTLDDYICPIEVKEKIKSYIVNNSLPHLIFEGSYGIGKTSLAKLLVKLFDASHLYINASLKTSIDVIREEVTNFCSRRGSKSFKIVILDECERLSTEAQEGLKGFIENPINVDVRFIFTTNNYDKVNDGIKSRCATINFVKPTLGQLRKKLKYILDDKEIIFNGTKLGKGITKIPNANLLKDNLQKVIERANYGIRDAIKILSDCCVTGEFILSESTVEEDMLTSIIEVLREHELVRHDRLVLIKQIVAESKIKEFDSLYKGLFNTIDQWVIDEYYPDVIKFLHKYSYEGRISPNKELCFLALISEIL